MIATFDPNVRQGQSLTHADLFRETVEAFRRARITRTDLANRIGISLPSVSRALRTEGGRFAGVQRRIIEELTPYRVSAEPTFRVERKGEG